MYKCAAHPRLCFCHCEAELHGPDLSDWRRFLQGDNPSRSAGFYRTRLQDLGGWEYCPFSQSLDRSIPAPLILVAQLA
jgi:hypothetical protein